MSFKDYIQERMGSQFRNLIIVDIQPLYQEAIENKFTIEEFGDFLKDIKKNILYFYNGPDTIGSDDSPDNIMSWLIDNNPSLEDFDWNKVEWKDKGYSFYRDFYDAGVSMNGMKIALRHMAMNRVHDSRDISYDEWKKILPEKDFLAVEYGLEDGGLSIWDPDISIADLKNNWNGSLLCGGGENECLKEIQILMSIFNIQYRLVEKFIF